MSSDTWDGLARRHGRKSVMSLSIDDATLDAETARQIPIIRDAIRPLLYSYDRRALDFGCGYGRFTGMLADLTNGHAVGFDPCQGLIDDAIDHDSVTYLSAIQALERCQFDLVFAAMVIGNPDSDPEALARQITDLLAPGGLLVVIDHMPLAEVLRWWKFRPAEFYIDMFGWSSVPLAKIGTFAQLDNTVTILAGRKAAV